MRILQLIDSLEAGGAERMAVNYANALQKEFSFSALCTTRKQGPLRDSLLEDVHYLFLNKKKAVDFRSIFKLKSFIKKNKIDFIHAHSTSFFIAVLVKFVYPKIKIVWHDHYGNSEFLRQRNYKVLRIMSHFFFAIISVNQQLSEWATVKLYCKKITYLPNFTTLGNSSEKSTTLEGSNGKRILCLANLRSQKGHFFLLEIAEKIKAHFPDWTFHLVGKDFGDKYATDLKNAIVEQKLENVVFMYGSKNDITNIIEQSDICILTSSSEGLPVAILEYGFNKKPVLTTNVGDIKLVVEECVSGFLCEFGDNDEYFKKLSLLINDTKLRKVVAFALNKTIQSEFSESGVLKKYVEFLKKSR